LSSIQVSSGCSYLLVVAEAEQYGQSGLICQVQERNLKHPNGGPEASRISAAARRKLANLGSSLDQLADMLESPECASV